MIIMMSENMLTSSKCRKRLYSSAIALGFVSIATSAAILVPILVMFIEECSSCRSYFTLMGIVSIALFVFGLLILSTIVYSKRWKNSPTPQVVVSLIPAEDLEKSAAPILPYNHVPHHWPFFETSSIDLPDYFTVQITQNRDEVYLSVEANVQGENVPETPPPCYEEALEMATDVANSKSQENDEDIMQEVYDDKHNCC